MTKREKLLSKLLEKSKNFTYNELRSLLNGLGYKELTLGKTSGSRVAFINENTNHLIRLHKPHPSNKLKRYQLDFIEIELRNLGVIK